MSFLQVIKGNEEQKWDEIVRSFKIYDVNYLSGYAKAFELIGEGEPLLFYFDDGRTKAVNVVFKRDIALAEPFKEKLPLETWFDLSTPYGYGGFWIEGENYKTVNDTYEAYCKDNGFVSEFVRFNLFSGYQPYFTGLSETHMHNVVRNLDISLEDMLMDFENNVRRSIKKANKAGLRAEIDLMGKRLDDFLEIYYGTMERTGAKKSFFFPKVFFQKINEMEGNYFYIHVFYKEKVISTSLYLHETETCYAFLGGTNKDYFDLQPNYYLDYEAFKWAKNKGLKRIVLGGGYGNNDGIYRYKKSFAPNGLCDFYIGKKIYDEEKYRKLVEIRTQEDSFDKNTLFFPAYRG